VSQPPDRAFWSDRRVFITGCSRLLGSWATSELNRLGATTIGLVRDRNRRFTDDDPEIVPHLIVEGSLEDYDTVLRAINEHEADIQTNRLNAHAVWWRTVSR
jgi:CDP-glucose 4,6-dehydratase